MRRATPVTADVRLETHHIANWLTSALLAVFMLTLFLALTSQAMAAPEVFKASASFQEGQLSGTVTIDTATGNLVSADLIITQGRKKIAFTTRAGSAPHMGGTRLQVFGADFAEVFLTLPVSTLVGFQGGSMESGYDGIDVSGWIPGGQYFFGSEPNYPLISGTLEPR